MAICSATTACASKNASFTSGLRSVEKLSPTIGTTNRPFTGILSLSQRVAHAHCLSRALVGERTLLTDSRDRRLCAHLSHLLTGVSSPDLNDRISCSESNF